MIKLQHVKNLDHSNKHRSRWGTNDNSAQEMEIVRKERQLCIGDCEEGTATLHRRLLGMNDNSARRLVSQNNNLTCCFFIFFWCILSSESVLRDFCSIKGRNQQTASLIHVTAANTVIHIFFIVKLFQNFCLHTWTTKISDWYMKGQHIIKMNKFKYVSLQSRKKFF